MTIQIPPEWLSDDVILATAERVHLAHPRYPIASALISRIRVLLTDRFDKSREREIRDPLPALLQELVFGSMHLEHYVTQLESECEMGLFAIGQCQHALARMHTRDHDVRHQMMNAFWAEAHSFFVHCANVSKLLWPGAANTERGQSLRRELGIQRVLVISNRDLRNNLEHYDEQIDAWIREERSLLIDRNIGPPNRMIDPPPDPRDCFRSYDPERATFGFRDVEMDARKMVAELEMIRAAATRWHDELRTNCVYPRARPKRS